MSLGSANLDCAWALVDELVRGGMSNACISPGSRSTPLALALDRHPAVTTFVHLDERSMAFFAVGLAKESRRPVVVACTSGTAAAELWPAVVEASQSMVPLVLVTADRPPRLRGTTANQTIDQVGLYGSYAEYLEPRMPSVDDAPIGDWRKSGEEAARVAVFGKSRPEGARPPGPVQVNCSFDEPLFPEGEWRPPSVPAKPGGLERAYTLPAFDYPDFVELVGGVERGMLVAGSHWVDAADTLVLAERLGWPVLAEPTSSVRVPGRALAAGQGLIACATWMASMTPEVIVHFGAADTARAMQRLVASTALVVVEDSHHPRLRPEHDAALRVRPRRPGIGRELSDVLPPPPGETDWLLAWQSADRAARDAIDEVLDLWPEPFEGRIARDLAAAVADGGSLVVGSSMPIRDVDYYMEPREGLRVLANRGASGIDGFVSTALGVAAAGAPTFALCGDLTFLHDVGALFWNAGRGLDLVLVVVNNDGGTIFGYLAQRDLPEFERLFRTPHGLDLGAICGAAGVGHANVRRANELIPAVHDAASAGGIRVVEVMIDPELDRVRHREVQDAVDEALRDLR